MKLIDKISADFKTALLESRGNELARAKKNFLGVLKTEVTKESREPEDAYIVGKIKSMVKNAESTNSLDDMELDILNSYLPKQLSEDDLRGEIINYIKQNEGANMGQVMSFLKNTFEGEYDGKMASTIVREIL